MWRITDPAQARWFVVVLTAAAVTVVVLWALFATPAPDELTPSPYGEHPGADS